MRTAFPGAVAFRPDAHRLTIGAPNGDLLLWDTSVHSPPQQLSRLRHGRGIVAAAWNPVAASLLATVSIDGTATAWRLPGDRVPERTARWPALPARPRHVGWAAGGRWVYTVASDGRASVWDTRASARVGQADVTSGRPITAAHHRADTLIVITDSGWARLWNPRDKPGDWIRLTGTPVVACAWSDTLLALAGTDGRIACFDADLRLVRSLWTEQTHPRALACANDGSLVAVFPDGRAMALDPDGAARWRTPLGVPGPTSVAVAGNLVAVAGVARPVLLTLDTGRQVTPAAR